MSAARPLQQELAKLIARWGPREGIQASPIAGVSCINVSRTQKYEKRHWHASFCIVVQGVKELSLEGQLYREREPHYIVSPIDLPVTSRVSGATPAHPFLALKLDFDLDAFREVAAQLDPTHPETPVARAIFLGRASDRILEAAIRLCE